VGPITRADLLRFLEAHRTAVQCSVASGGAPQAAVIGVAVTADLELVFDTLESTRKVANLRADPRIALVLGGGDGEEITVQYEGLADFPAGEELHRLREVYYAAFPDGPQRLAWPGLVYVRVRPTWIRYSDYRGEPAVIEEFRF